MQENKTMLQLTNNKQSLNITKIMSLLTARCLRIMWQRWCYTEWLAMTIFSVTQLCNIISTLFWMVATLYQHFQAVLCQKFVVANCSKTYITIINYYCHNTFLIELIPAKCAEDSNETRGEAPSNKGNAIISLLWQLRFHCNPDLIKLWGKFFHIFFSGDIVFVQTWEVLALNRVLNRRRQPAIDRRLLWDL